MKKIYKSKVDAWLLFFVFGAMVIPMLPILFIEFSIVILASILFVLIFILSILFNIKYVIEDEVLYIKTAYLYTEKININDIIEISSTKTIVSAPAASLDRIKIKCGRNVVIISPKDKEIFVEDLCRISDHDIKVDI